MFRCAQVHQVAAHVEKALGMQVNWLLNNTNASPHMRTNWRVLMYLSKARHVQGFLVVEQIGSAFKTTAPCSLRRDSVVTYDTSSRTPAQLGIRVRTAHSLPKHPFILIRTRDSSHRIEARKTPCIITYLSRPRLVDGKKNTNTNTCFARSRVYGCINRVDARALRQRSFILHAQRSPPATQCL